MVVKKASRTVSEKRGGRPVTKEKPRGSKPGKRTNEQVLATTLPAAMTGRASPAKAKDGDDSVLAYIRSLLQPQRGIAERVDALDEPGECGQAC
ncbi:MAG: hypothetical protein ABIO49_06020 [Dokdonella sp.]